VLCIKDVCDFIDAGQSKSGVAGRMGSAGNALNLQEEISLKEEGEIG
jgi:hypothetical protein